jgi:hypothetical protein
MNKDEFGNPAIYLGDSVYAVYHIRRNDVCLTVGTHSEREAQAVIWLEPSVMDKLVKFWQEQSS